MFNTVKGCHWPSNLQVMSENSEIIFFFINETFKLDILSVLEALGENVGESFSSFYSRYDFTMRRALHITHKNTVFKNLNCKLCARPIRSN